MNPPAKTLCGLVTIILITLNIFSFGQNLTKSNLSSPFTTDLSKKREISPYTDATPQEKPVTVKTRDIHYLPFSEDFSEGALPADWQNINDTSNYYWTFNNPGGITLNSTTSANGFADFNDDILSSSAPPVRADLITPTFDMSANEAVILEFEHYFQFYQAEQGEVYVSADDGSTWDLVTTFTSTTSNAETVELDLTSWAAGESAVKIKFRYNDGNGSWGYYWAIDDIYIYEPLAFDVGVTNWIEPISECALSDSSTIAVEVTNFGYQTTPDTIPICYSIDGGTTVVWDTIFDSIAPENTILFYFTPAADFSTPSVYHIFAATAMGSDMLTVNDTVHNTILSKPLISDYPYFQNFEDTSYWSVFEGSTNPSWELGTPSTVNISSAASGINAWVTNLDGNYNISEGSTVVSPCFDFTGMVKPILELKINYETEATDDRARFQYSKDNGVTWEMLGTYGEPFNWYNSNQGWTGSSGGWLAAKHDLDSLIGEPNVRFRILFLAASTTNNEGFAFDDILIYDAYPSDVSVTEWIEPLGGCGMGQDTIIVKVMNFGTDTTPDTIPVVYSIDNGATFVVDTIFGSIPVDGSTVFSFSTPADFSTAGFYNCIAATALETDENNMNDSLFTSLTSILTVDTYPYFEDFEDSLHFWVAGGTNSSWALDPPQAEVINSAASGQFAWVTNPDGDVNDAERSYVEGPCFDFSSLELPVIELKIWYECYYYDPDLPLDGAAVQYSLDEGATWQHLGNYGDPNNWYNYDDIYSYDDQANTSGWSGNDDLGSGGWLTAWRTSPELAGEPSVKLRVYFASYGISYNDEGFAFDDIHIYDTPPIDVGVTEWVNPLSGCGLTDSDTVTVVVSNLGTDPTADTIPLAYSNNGGSTFVIDTIFGSLPVGGDTIFSFTATGDFSALGDHECIAYTSLEGDSLQTNDTVFTTVTTILTVDTYPYFEDFEDSLHFWAAGGTNSSWALDTPQAEVIDTAASGLYAWVTNPDGNANEEEKSYVEGPCFDFSSLELPVIALKIWYECYYYDPDLPLDGAAIQYSLDEGATWQHLGNYGDPNNWYNYDNIYSYDDQANTSGWSGNDDLGSGGWLTAWHSSPELAGEPAVKLRVYFATYGFGYNDEGFAFDDIHIYDTPPIDVGVTEWISPVSGCGLTDSDTVTVKVSNLGTDPTPDTIPVAYSIDSGSTFVIDTIFGSLPVGGDTIFSFDSTADFSALGEHECIVYTFLDQDTLAINDTLFITITTIPTISSFPYFEDFEDTTTHYWEIMGTNPSWELGEPENTIIDTAASGINAWVTNLTGMYNNSDQSWVESPCFDLSAIELPVIGMSILWETEQGYDGAAVQYSADGGTTWSHIGIVGDMFNWYNSNNISGLSYSGSTIGWAGQNSGSDYDWMVADHQVPEVAGAEHVKFRVVFGSDGSVTEEGFAFDDIRIYEALQDLAMYEIVTPDSGCGLSDSEPVEIIIQSMNFDTIPAGDSIPVIFEVNGTPSSTEYIPVTQDLFAGDTINYIFTQTADLSASGAYEITVYVIYPDDTVAINDTLITNVYSFPLPVIDLGEDTTYTQAPFSMTLDAGPGYDSYLWQDGSTEQTFEVNYTGTYYVAVIDSNGCTNSDTIVVSSEGLDVSVINMTEPVSACELSNAEDISIEITNPGITAMDAGDTIPVAYTIDAGTPVQDILILTSPFAPDDTISYTFTTPGDFSVAGVHDIVIFLELITDVNIYNDTLYTEVEMYGLPDVNIYGLEDFYCTDAGLISLSGNPPGGTFSGPGVSGYVFDVNDAGPGSHQIIYSYTDSMGCTGADTQMVDVFQAITVDLGPDTIGVTSYPYTLDAGSGYASYLWNDGSTDQTLEVNADGTYTVTVTSADGCTATDMVYVYDVDNVPDINGDDLQISVFPNPNKGIFDISIENKDMTDMYVEILNVIGQPLYFRFEKNSLLYKDNIDITSWPAGIYYIKVSTGNRVTVKKIICQ